MGPAFPQPSVKMRCLHDASPAYSMAARHANRVPVSFLPLFKTCLFQSQLCYTCH